MTPKLPQNADNIQIAAPIHERHSRYVNLHEKCVCTAKAGEILIENALSAVSISVHVLKAMYLCIWFSIMISLMLFFIT